MQAQLQQLVPHSPQCVRLKPHLNMLSMDSLKDGVDLDVLLVQNVQQNRADPLGLVKPLLGLSDDAIKRLAAAPPDRSRERAVAEAHTAYVARQEGRVNLVVRLFKVCVLHLVGLGPCSHGPPWSSSQTCGVIMLLSAAPGIGGYGCLRCGRIGRTWCRATLNPRCLADRPTSVTTCSYATVRILRLRSCW